MFWIKFYIEEINNSEFNQVPHLIEPQKFNPILVILMI